MDFQKRLQGEISVPLIKETTRQNGELIENEDYASAGSGPKQRGHTPWSMPEDQTKKEGSHP
jgi:hypothetical protein